MDYEITRTDEQWREQLDPARYAILRQAATERAFSGALLDEHRRAIDLAGDEAQCGARRRGGREVVVPVGPLAGRGTKEFHLFAIFRRIRDLSGYRLVEIL